MNNLGAQPRWSPAEDAFIVPGSDGFTRLERPNTGEAHDLPIAWPARFDDTGLYAYSISVPGDPFTLAGSTTIVDVGTNSVVATWSGQPELLWLLERGVVAHGDEPAALLGQSDRYPGGTAVHRVGLPDGVTCLDGAQGAAWDPTHDLVAFSRPIDPGPGTEPPFDRSWEIVVHNLRSGDETVLFTGIRPPAAEPPLLRWSPDSTRLLVQWPSPTGL